MTRTRRRWPSAMHGHGREFANFAFVSIGTGIGMGLVIDGKLHRGVHGAPPARSPTWPISGGEGTDEQDARRRAATWRRLTQHRRSSGRPGAPGIARPVSARLVFTAAAWGGNARAAAVVADEARLVARAICAIIAFVDPELVVLDGGIGQAPGFAARGHRPAAPAGSGAARGYGSAPWAATRSSTGAWHPGADLAWTQLTALLLLSLLFRRGARCGQASRWRSPLARRCRFPSRRR